MIEHLSDVDEFRERRDRNWEKNVSYWLSQPLRHVVDVGDRIVSRVLSGISGVGDPVVVDLGFGSGWLADRLIEEGYSGSYIGVDINDQFLSDARTRFSGHSNIEFMMADLEASAPSRLLGVGDVIVNAFNFFELADIKAGMGFARAVMKESGLLLATTIEVPFLIWAVSNTIEDWIANLRAYAETEKPRFFFQPIDLGARASEELFYPSVLHDLEDFTRAAAERGLSLQKLQQWDYTHRPIPKVYVHLEFSREVL